MLLIYYGLSPCSLSFPFWQCKGKVESHSSAGPVLTLGKSHALQSSPRWTQLRMLYLSIWAHHSRVVTDVWKKDVWEFQAKSGSSGSCCLSLHFLGRTAVQEMSGIGSVWLRFGSVSGLFRVRFGSFGWGRVGVGERGFCKGKEYHGVSQHCSTHLTWDRCPRDPPVLKIAFRFCRNPRGIFSNKVLGEFCGGFFGGFFRAFFLGKKQDEKIHPKIHGKIQIRIWEFRGQNPHCKDLALKDLRTTSSLVFSHRGSASQRISAARTRIARISASHRIAISVFITHRRSHRIAARIARYGPLRSL